MDSDTGQETGLIGEVHDTLREKKVIKAGARASLLGLASKIEYFFSISYKNSYH